MLLVALAGLPGTGKSTLARALAAELDLHVLDKDRVREALFGPGRVEHTREQDDLVCRCLYAAAGHLARRGAARGAVLDGRTFTRRAALDELRSACAEHGLELRVVECVAAPEVARARLARDRELGAHPAADRGPELHDRLAASAEPVPAPKLVVATDRDTTAEHVARVRAWLGR